MYEAECYEDKCDSMRGVNKLKFAQSTDNRIQ
jgi:hypothetical protein